MMKEKKKRYADAMKINNICIANNVIKKIKKTHKMGDDI